MKNLIYINACMRTGSRTQRIATPIIEELRKRYNVETIDLTKNLYHVADNYTPEEIEERVSYYNTVHRRAHNRGIQGNSIRRGNQRSQFPEGLRSKHPELL